MLEIFPFLLGFMLGACLGSFASALIWRVPRKIPWTVNTDKTPARSICTSCERTLGGGDLIPIVSWIFQQGKCRTCGQAISSIYPLLEIFSGIIGGLVFTGFGISIISVLCLLAFTFLTIFCHALLWHKYFARDIFAIWIGFVILILIIWVFTGF